MRAKPAPTSSSRCTHTGHDADYALQNSHKFDLIVSGHDHDLRIGYDGVSAYVETSTEANYVPIVDLNVVLTPAEGDNEAHASPGRQASASSTPRPSSPTPIRSPSSTSSQTKLSAELDVEIGTTANELNSQRAVVRGEESAWGNIIADAMKGANGADVAITNGGGIRGDKVYPAGTVLTRKDVFTELPFGNKTVVTEITGADLLAALENGFSQFEQGAGPLPAGLGHRGRSRCHQGAGRPRGVGPRQWRAARSGRQVQGRHQRLHDGWRRRLHRAQQGQCADRRPRRRI